MLPLFIFVNLSNTFKFLNFVIVVSEPYKLVHSLGLLRFTVKGLGLRFFKGLIFVGINYEYFTV